MLHCENDPNCRGSLPAMAPEHLAADMTDAPLPDGNGDRRGGLLKIILFAAVLALLAAGLKWTDLGRYFSRPFVENLLGRLGPWAPLGYILIYAVGAVLMVPGTLITAMGGIFFGPALGTALVVAGATAGAAGAFLTSRFLARDFIQGKFGSSPWFAKLEEGVARKGIRFILFVRLVPVFPFNWLNYACGLTGVTFRDYLIGTFFGIMPASFVFTNAASQMANAAAGEGVGASFYFSLTLLGLFAAASMIYKGREDRATAEKE